MGTLRDSTSLLSVAQHNNTNTASQHKCAPNAIKQSNKHTPLSDDRKHREQSFFVLDKYASAPGGASGSLSSKFGEVCRKEKQQNK